MTLISQVGGASGPLYGTFFLRASNACAERTTECDGNGPARGRGSAARAAMLPGNFGLCTAALEANTSIGFKVAESQDGSFLALYDEDNSLVQAAVTLNAAQAYALPDRLFAWPYFKLWSQDAGVDVNQTAARSFVVLLKS